LYNEQPFSANFEVVNMVKKMAKEQHSQALTLLLLGFQLHTVPLLPLVMTLSPK